MLLLLFILAVLFVLLPLDAQLWLLSGVRLIWLSDEGRMLALGGIGATVTALFWYAVGWNALAYKVYLEDMTRVEDTYRKRRR